MSDGAAVRSFSSVWKPTGRSSGHGRDDLDHFAVLPLDGALDGLLHVDHAVRLQGRRQLSSLGDENKWQVRKWKRGSEREAALGPREDARLCCAASAASRQQVKPLLG